MIGSNLPGGKAAPRGVPTRLDLPCWGSLYWRGSAAPIFLAWQRERNNAHMSIKSQRGDVTSWQPGPLTSVKGASLVMVVLVGLASTVACSKIDELKSRMTFREANAAYQGQ